MAEPTLPELLRVAFDTVREIGGEDPVSLAWPDDIDGQARCIRHLSDMATNPRRKSSTPCNTKFMRAMDDVVRFFSSPKMRPKKVRGSPPARSTCSIAPSSIPPVPQAGS